MRVLPLCLLPALLCLPPAHAGHACVDPADATARRWVQEQPCRLPMYEALPPGAGPQGEPAARPVFAAPAPPAMAGHAMFWRFPVQGHGRWDAPRHSWR